MNINRKKSKKKNLQKEKKYYNFLNNNILELEIIFSLLFLNALSKISFSFLVLKENNSSFYVFVHFLVIIYIGYICESLNKLFTLLVTFYLFYYCFETEVIFLFVFNAKFLFYSSYKLIQFKKLLRSLIQFK